MTALSDFVHDTAFTDLPKSVIHHAKRSLLDTLGVAVAGSQTQLSTIIRQHVLNHFGAGEFSARMLFDGRKVSPVGAALAGAMQIDSVDAHDGHKLTKGHVGCGVVPALLALSDTAESFSEEELLTGLVLGYEIGTRAGIALHQEACDYHTSGAWIALAVAALGARVIGLDTVQTREALGIAEYHGPRSQMMRVIDHPTMLKDGSGWGAMAGVSAAFLAKDGFTGAPAISVEATIVDDIWNDLAQRWYISEQYFKPFPVCRWAQPAIIAALSLKASHNIDANDIKKIVIGTFHESRRLATPNPITTEQAQYSLPFPVACALVHGDVTVEHIHDSGLRDDTVSRLSNLVEYQEIDEYNDAFPARRISAVQVETHSGDIFDSGPTEAAGDPENPLSDEELFAKFDRFTDPLLGGMRAQFLRDEVMGLGERPDLSALSALLYSAVDHNAKVQVHSNNPFSELP